MIIIEHFLYQKDNDFELHLKRKPNSWFVNNNFNDGSKAWQANMNTQPVFNEYKAVTFMHLCFSKREDQCSQATKEATKKALENNLHHYETTQTNSQAYISKRECSVKEKS